MLYKPKWLQTKWIIGLLVFIIVNTVLANFIECGLGLGEDIVVSLAIHADCLIFILLAIVLKPIKRAYIFLAFVLLANEISASFWGIPILGYNPFLRIHSVIGFAMMTTVVLGVDWSSSITRSDVDSILFLIFICGVLSCLYAMTVQFDVLRRCLSGADQGWYYTSFLGHRNQYSAFLYVATIPALYLWQRSRNIVYPIFVAIFFLNIVVTDSRNAFYSIILLLGLYFAFLKKISLGTIAILGVFVLLFAAINFDNISWMFAHKSGQGLEEESRFVMWSLMLAKVYEHEAWLSGFGFGAQEPFLISHGFRVASAHNTFVSLIFDGGIIKLTIYIVLLMIIYRNICRHPDHRYRDLMRAGSLSFMFYNMFDNSSLLFSANGFVSIMATIILALLPQYRMEN